MLEQLKTLLAPPLDALGFELWGFDLFKRGKRSVLRVYIDQEGGVTVDDCSLASQQVAALLDVENVFQGAYDLEVSSPGEERPLFSLAHYQRFVGERVHITLMSDALEARRNYTGELLAVNGETLSLMVDGETYELPYSAIKRGHKAPLVK